MEVFHGQHILFARVYPYLTLGSLTFGTMSVTATVVAYTHAPTLWTNIHMTAQRGGTALFQARENLKDPAAGMILADKGRFETGDDLSDFKFCPHGIGRRYLPRPQDGPGD